MKFVKARFNDAEILATLIKKVAEEEGRGHEATITANILQEDGFSANPAFHAYLAYSLDEQVVGFCFYYFMYSGWQGRKILFIEDLYILPAHRGHGYGSLFFQKMAQVADMEGLKLAWETDRERFNSRNYYEGLGAKDRAHKIGFFMGGAALERCASQYDSHKQDINDDETDQPEAPSKTIDVDHLI